MRGAALCVRARAHTHSHTHTHTRARARAHTLPYTYSHTHTHRHTHTHTHTHQLTHCLAGPQAKGSEDPHHCGLVLEWVYGSIVSTAEKARDGAKRNLGSYLPAATDAHHALLRALEEQYVWETRVTQARALLQVGSFSVPVVYAVS